MAIQKMSPDCEPGSKAGIDRIPSGVWIGSLLSVAVVAILLRYTSLNNHDNSWLLYLVGEYLKGARLYVDLIEVNPPLIIFLYVPPVWIAQLLSLEVINIFYTYVFALAMASCWLCCCFLLTKSAINRWVVALIIIIALFVLPRGDFGQREHLMVMFSLPYIFLIMRRVEGQPCNKVLATFIGLLALLGFGLKPYFLIVPAVLEAYLLLSSRNLKQIFRPETWSLGLGLVGYVGVIFLFTPDYITFVVPMALEVYNQAFTNSYMKVIFRQELIFIVLLMTTGGILLYQKRVFPSSVFALFLALFLSGCAAYVMYVMQMKGWRYHLYPALAFLFIACGVIVAEWSKHTNSGLTSYAIIILGAFVLLGLPVSFMMDYSYKNASVKNWRKLIEENQPVTAIYSLSSTLRVGFPLVTHAHLQWSSRFPALWILPGVIRGKATASGEALQKIIKIEKYHTDAVIEDLTKFNPEFVIVDVRTDKTHYDGIPFDFIDYFSKDIRFKTLWSNYHKVGHSDLGFDFYSSNK